MSEIIAVMVDTKKEPKGLKFENAAVTYSSLPSGDLYAVTDDGHEIVVERKTPDDFLNRLESGEIFWQIAKLSENMRMQRLRGEQKTIWAYLVITDTFKKNKEGKIITERGITKWSFAAVEGALVKIQQIGVYVIYCNGIEDYANCIMRIGRMDKSDEIIIKPPHAKIDMAKNIDPIKIANMPAKEIKILNDRANFLLGLPDVGIERVQEILKWSGDSPAIALVGITDLSIPCPLGTQYRKNIKSMLGLEENQTLELGIQKEITNVKK